MIRLIIGYALTTLVFFAIDLVWLGVVARGVYNRCLGHLLGDVNWAAAIVFYLLFIVVSSISLFLKCT